MADTKISALTAVTAVTDDDYAVVVDDPAGTPVTKRITIANLRAALNALLLTTRGDLMTRGAAVVQRLAIGTANQVLKTDGTDPVWGTIDTANITADAVTFPKMVNIATDSLMGRDTAASGDPENILLNATLSMDGSGNLQRAALTGDVTATAGSNATTIANDVVTYAKMQNVSATSRIMGRKTASAGDMEELTAADVITMLGATHDIIFVIDGGGSTITTGVKGDLQVDFGCTIVSASMFADQSGSIVVNVWKDTYANYPPVVGDKITASAPPTISAATKSTDSTLTGWTKTITAGDTLRFNVDSVTTVQRVTVVLKVTKT